MDPGGLARKTSGPVHGDGARRSARVQDRYRAEGVHHLGPSPGVDLAPPQHGDIGRDSQNTVRVDATQVGPDQQLRALSGRIDVEATAVEQLGGEALEGLGGNRDHVPHPICAKLVPFRMERVLSCRLP